MKRLKKGAAKLLVLLLALVLTLCMFASCAAGGDKVMWYGEQELSEADYAYLMAMIKEYYAYYCYYYYGQDLSDMWGETLDNGETFADMLTETVNDSAKMMLVVEQLCAEAGLTIDDKETLAEISNYMQEMVDDYGGKDAMEIELAKLGMNRSSVERYERYNQLLSLLRDYRYGQNGVARISREEVLKSFLASYAKVEGYFYSYLLMDDNSSYAYYQYDFASDYADADVSAFFTDRFFRVNYLRFKKEADAQAAYAALTDGSATYETYAETADAAKEDAYLTEEDMSDALHAGISGIEPDNWFLSGEEDGFYYVVQRLAFSASDLDEDIQKTVRKAMLQQDAKAFFEENYVTVKHILYKDEAKAKEVYDAILAGTTTFEEHEDDTIDSSVQYTFTHGAMVKAFDDAAYKMEVGAYDLVQTDYGWHLMTRLELDAKGFDLEDVTAAMSRELMQEDAEKTYNALKSGGAKFEKPAEDALYTYTEPTLLTLSSQAEELKEAIEHAKDDEIIRVDLDGYGVYILRKIAIADEDLDEVYDTVEKPLVDEAFYSYLEGFFDAVRVDSGVLGRFDIKTAKTLSY